MKALIENIDFRYKQIIVEYTDPYGHDNVRRAIPFPKEVTEETIIAEVKFHTPQLFFKEQHEAKMLVEDGHYDNLVPLIGTELDYTVDSNSYNSEVY